jgi:hypothetical protein
MGLERQPQANSGYKIYGLTVCSALPLPGLPPADPDLAEILVSYGPASDYAAEASPLAPDCWVSITACRFWCRVQGVARYLVPDKRRIIISPDPGADPRLVRQYLLAPVLYAPLYGRGLIPLHATAVEAGGGAVLLAGRKGAGKSSLAALLRRRGYRLIADDFCVTVTAAPGGIVALPGPPHLKLWPDMIEYLGEDRAALEPLSRREEKFCLPLAGDYCPAARPVTHIYLLSPTEGQGFSLTSLAGAGKLFPLLENTYFVPALDLAGLRDQHFRHLAALARQARVVAISYPRRQGLFQELADTVERDLLESPITRQ